MSRDILKKNILLGIDPELSLRIFEYQGGGLQRRQNSKRYGFRNLSKQCVRSVHLYMTSLAAVLVLNSNHGYWNRVRQSYNSTIIVILASVRCLRHNSRYSTQRIGHRSQGQIDSSDVRHVQIFLVPNRPFIRAQASLRYLIDYLDSNNQH